MHELAEKARACTLSLEEHIEMDNYERVGQVLSLMKSKAQVAEEGPRCALKVVINLRLERLA